MTRNEEQARTGAEDIDLEVPGSPEAPEQNQIVGSDRYTMTEAAKLKGVSYHTVSRAVRKGRLPVVRLGRMALISAEDLRAWRPMRERAPRRYRGQQVAREASPIFLDTALGDHLELTKEISSVYEVIHGAAAELPLAQFAKVLCQHMARIFHLSRASLWVVSEDGTRAKRLGIVGSQISSMRSDIDLASFPFFKQLLDHSPARMSMDPQTESPVAFDSLRARQPGPILFMPLRVGRRPVGALFGDRNGQAFALSPDQMALVNVLANQVALAVDNALLREREQHRISQLSWILEQTSDAVRACDADGKLTLINAADRKWPGLSDSSVYALGSDARENPAVLARHELDDTPIPIDQHPLNRALRGEHLEGWEYVVTLASDDRINVVVNAKPIVVNGEITGAVYAARDVTAAREARQRDVAHAEETAQMQAQANAIIQLLRDTNAATTRDEVISAAVQRMRIELAGDHALVLMRDDNGTLTLQDWPESGYPDALQPQYDPLSLPNFLLAFAQQQPVLLTRDSAGATEARLMAAFDAAALLIIPLLAESQPIGLAIITYSTLATAQRVDLGFVATLGNQSALTIKHVHLAGRFTASYQRLLQVIDQMPQGVLIIDAPDGTVRMANQAACELFGERIAPGAIRADQLRMVDDDGRLYDRDAHPLFQPLRSGESFLGQPLTVQRGDGTLLDVLGSHSPIIDDDGEIAGVVSVLQDREHFRSLDRVRDEFLSVVAHELRNPLTSLRGNLQLIQRRNRKRDAAPDDQDVYHRIDLVIEQVDRIAELVSRMLDISRVGLGRLDLSIAATDASEIARSVVTTVGGIAAGREIRVTAPERLPVQWDEVRVEQILVNLLTNAVRYAPDGPIDVDVRKSGEHQVCITVRDYGPGVPTRIQKRLFKQYYRFDDGQEDRERALDGSQGLGIGLYISARLARAHGGTLEVERAEGGGARFLLTLPEIAVEVSDQVPASL
jgi:excisionase family DNA binding protein